MKHRIFLSPPHMNGSEMDYIASAFESNYIAPGGDNVIEFEKDLEGYLNCKNFALAVNSGTSAIHLALILLGVTKNDTVICQTNSFIATANPILYLGAKPILIDSETDTYNMCPHLLEEAIKDSITKEKYPRAIIVAHIYGMPCKFDEIKEIADRYSIPLIEDSAEALGSKYKSTQCGCLGAFGILSFNGNKIITTSGGGALITSNHDLKNTALYYSNQAKEAGIEYLHQEIGYNYRMSNILAGIGRAQMKVLDERILKRRKIYDFYAKEIEELQFLKEPKDSYSNRWLTTALLKNREKRDGLIRILEENNIEARPMWKPIHLQNCYRTFPKYLNGLSEDLNERGICLPSGSSMSREDLNRIKFVINSYISHNA